MKCGPEGKWDKSFQFCSTKGFCPKPVDKNGKIMAVACGEHHKPGDECEIKCDESLTPVIEYKVMVWLVIASSLYVWSDNFSYAALKV